MQKIFNKLSKHPILIFIALFCIALIFYGGSLRYGFSQDDFFHFSISRVAVFNDFVQFFIPNAQAWQFYRPISTQLVYWSFASLFGYTKAAFPMHMFMILIHAINGYLVYRLILKLKLSPITAGLVSVGYLISGVHFLSLFYIGALQELLATMGSLLVILSTIDKKVKSSIGWFIFALLSKEIALRVIPIIFVIHLLLGENLVGALKRSKYLFVAALAYIIFRLTLGVNGASEYSLSFSFATTLATTMWYGLMTIGFPEHILNYGLSAGKIDFVRYLSELGMVGWVNMFSAVLVLFAFLHSIYIRLINKQFAPVLCLLILWLFGLAPILLLPTHRYAHYLDLSLIFFLLLIVEPIKSKLKLYSLVLFVVFASLTSIYIDTTTHWTTSRSDIASRFNIFLHESGGCQYSNLVLSGDLIALRQLGYALADSNGPQVLCNNFDLKVYYLGITKGSVPDNAQSIKVDNNIIWSK